MKTNIAALVAGMLFVVGAGRAEAAPIACEDALKGGALAGTLTDTNAFGAYLDAVHPDFIGDPHADFIAPVIGLYPLAVTNNAVDAPDVYTLIVNRILDVPEPPSGVLVGSLLVGFAATKRR